MYDFVNLSRDIAATPFPSTVPSRNSACAATTTTVSTHETVCPAFKGLLMIKVDVELGIVAIVGMRMRFVEARFVNYVIASALDLDVTEQGRVQGTEIAPGSFHRG
jgi:hypothetical protein